MSCVLFSLDLILLHFLYKAAKRPLIADANTFIFLSFVYLFVGQVVETGAKVIDFAKVLRALFLSPG